MTRNILKTLILVCIVAIFLVLNIFIIQPIFAKSNNDKADYKYHFQVLIEDDWNDKSSEDFRKNLIKKGNENNVFVEIIDVKEGQSTTELVEQGIYSKVDGIAFSANSKKQGDTLKQKAKNNKIEIVDFGMNSFKYKDMLSVGMDEAQLASTAVEEVCKLTNKSDEILVFLNNESKKSTMSNAEIINAFKKSYKKNGRKINNIRFVKVNKDKYEINSYIRKNIEKYRDCKAIVSLDANYSSIVGSIIANKDINRLSDKALVVYGDTSDNIYYMKKGIVDSVITSDGADMADKLIATMIDLKAGAKLRNYITKIVVID